MFCTYSLVTTTHTLVWNFSHPPDLLLTWKKMVPQPAISTIHRNQPHLRRLRYLSRVQIMYGLLRTSPIAMLLAAVFLAANPSGSQAFADIRTISMGTGAEIFVSQWHKVVTLYGMKANDANGWLSSEDNDDARDNEGQVTKEILADANANVKVKRKKGKNGYKGYKVLDNRDSLPFVVEVGVPDPYTNGEKMKRDARKNSKVDQEKKKQKMKKVPKYNLMGMDDKDGITSSIFAREKDGSLNKVLGSFSLDKSTNCGDLIEITVDKELIEFEVTRSRCQYKYAGGKRFVMVRKILEVKEKTRILQEEHLKRSLMSSELFDDDPPTLH